MLDKVHITVLLGVQRTGPMYDLVLPKQNLLEGKQTKRHKICVSCANAKFWQIGHQEYNNIHTLIVLFYSGLLHRLYCNDVLLALQHVFFLFLPCDLNIVKK